MITNSNPRIIIGSDGYMCSMCHDNLYSKIGDAQAHMVEKHPLPKRPKKHSKPKDVLRHPDASERMDIRKAITEAKQRKLPC
jgi:hypothetical protein